jgi:type III secretion protein D
LPPAAVRITAQDACALVEVLHGEISIAGQVHAAGAITPWARHQRLRIASAVVAFGLACEANWPVSDDPLAGPSAAPSAATGEPPHARPPEDQPVPAAKISWRRRPEAWLVGTGALVLLSCTAALQLSAGIGRGAAHPAVTAQANGVAAAAIASEPHEMRSSESLAQEVAEVFRIQGVPVSAHLAGPGHVQVKAQLADAAKLARVQDSARRDVRGLERLEVSNQPPPMHKPAPPLIDDPGKRIAALVTGAMAHVVTADGSRYFVGAQLPSGHRIAQVNAQALLLERDGEFSMLSF